MNLGGGGKRLALAAAVVAGTAVPALAEGGGTHGEPGLVWILPFVLILLSIALLPLIHVTEHWWHKNSSKLLVSTVLGLVVLAYYGFLRPFHADQPGLESVGKVLHHAVLDEYIPFIVLLFSLYTIAGGIELTGDLKASPRTNTAFLAVGATIASFVGTTGAAMLLIRPLLRTNKERRNVVHTVVFFIFAVCNCGGLLLPIGDPPLFLGYLRGVPFTWTLQLFPEFLLVNGILLAVYYLVDRRKYAQETVAAVRDDDTHIEPLRLNGRLNLLLLVGVVVCVALLDPNKPVPGTQWSPPRFLREGLMVGLASLSYFVPAFTPRGLRERVSFDFFAINEVACLFIGIFITMQVPLELLNIKGPSLGVDTPMEYFWLTGGLSSFLDNAPTYVVFFELSRSMPQEVIARYGETIHLLAPPEISVLLLKAVSCGAVFLGAMTYIGNGPNFLVRSIAEQAGVKMPSFFGYMKYSVLILGPIFVVISLVFFL